MLKRTEINLTAFNPKIPDLQDDDQYPRQWNFDPFRKLRESIPIHGYEQTDNQTVEAVTESLEDQLEHNNHNRIASNYEKETLLQERLNQSICTEFPFDQFELSAGKLGDFIGKEILFMEFIQNALSLAQLYTSLLYTEYLARIHEGDSFLQKQRYFYNYSQCALKFGNYIRERMRQDKGRLMTSKESPVRIENYYDRVINAINGVFGIDTPEGEENPMTFRNISIRLRTNTSDE